MAKKRKFVVGVVCETIDYRTVLARSKKEATKKAIGFDADVIDCDEVNSELEPTGKIESVKEVI